MGEILGRISVDQPPFPAHKILAISPWMWENVRKAPEPAKIAMRTLLLFMSLWRISRMELNLAQKEIISLMRSRKETMEDTVGIMLLLQEPKQQVTMLSWLVQNPQATTSDIIGQALFLTAKAE